MPIQVALSQIDGTYAVCRLPADGPLPQWVLGLGGFVSVTRTDRELSVTCRADQAPPGTLAEGGFAALEVDGPLPISLVGVLSAIASPLAEAGISLFAISTYDTDYILVKHTELEAACQALDGAGHRVSRLPAERLASQPRRVASDAERDGQAV